MLYVLLLIFLMLLVLIIRISRKSNDNTHQEQLVSPSTDLGYFCTKDSGYYVSVWPKDQKVGDFIEFDIAGMTYRDNIDDYIGEHVGNLEAEPSNPYDSNAIKVLAPDGYMVGYVPRNMTACVREFTTLPCHCYFYIGYYSDSEGIHYYSDCYIKR